MDMDHDPSPDLEEVEVVTQKRSMRNLYAVLIVTIIVLAGGIASLYILRGSSDGIPKQLKSISKSTRFTVYYPTELADGYTFDTNSVKFVDNILFYSVSKGEQKITISEQVIPPNPPDLKTIAGFNTLSHPNGSLAVGMAQGTPSALLLTADTLISVNGLKNTDQASVTKLAQNLSPIKK
jgi:hypothetical protein